MPVNNVVTATTIETDWGNDVANSVAAMETTLSDATPAATPGRLVERDGAGRAQVQTPAASSDIATKGYADALGTPVDSVDTIVRRNATGQFDTAAPTVGSHVTNKTYTDALGVTGNTPNTIMRRDVNGRVAAADPVLGPEVATKQYVDARIAGAGGTVSNGSTEVDYFRIGPIVLVAGTVRGGQNVTIPLGFQPAATETFGGVNLAFGDPPGGSVTIGTNGLTVGPDAGTYGTVRFNGWYVAA